MIYLSIGALLIIATKSQFCTSGADCAFDETCEYNPISNMSYCSTLPFCLSNADCEPYPDTAINVTCQSYPAIINDTSGNMTNISIPICLPNDQCQYDMECLLGSTCEVAQLNDTDFTFNYCLDFNTACTNNTDCGDPGLACWNSTFCVVTCMDDDDCGVSGYICDYLGISGMLACQPESLSMTSTTTTMIPSTTGADSSCDNDEYCENTFGSEYSCEYEPFTQSYSCANETSPFCQTKQECQDLPGSEVLNYDCNPVTINGISLLVCQPESQCMEDEDCLPGSECLITDAVIFTFGVCNLVNNTCTQDNDCIAIDDELRCWDNFCYLPCEANEDCDTEIGWYCQSPNDIIYGCLPLGVPNTTILTSMPTTAPTSMETTEELDVSSVSQFAIFGAVMIGIKHVLFM